MNRVFISLYLVIVLSVIFVGWGADKLWQFYNPEPQTSPYETLFFSNLELQLKNLDFTAAKEKAQSIGNALHQDIEVFTLEEFAQSELMAEIKAGYIVSLFDKQGRLSSYKRIGEMNLVLRVYLEQGRQDSRISYFALLVAFYGLIAIIVYFWIWPLSRDLSRLQQHTKHIGKEDNIANVELGPHSAIASLASAFNLMANRIHNLLATNKEMTYAVSHEIRTPLARMKFALEMATDTQNTKQLEKQLLNLRNDVKEMDSLINELMAYAAFDAQSQPLCQKEGDLLPLVETLLEKSKATAENTKINCEIIKELKGSLVYCEWYLMERCLHNIIQNAFKYCRQHVRISLSLSQDKCCVIVEDDGPGIPMEEADKVFNAFVRLRSPDEKNKSGFGLGLAIVHRVIKWHGGGVEIQKSTWGGAKLILYWPTKKAPKS